MVYSTVTMDMVWLVVVTALWRHWMNSRSDRLAHVRLCKNIEYIVAILRGAINTKYIDYT